MHGAICRLLRPELDTKNPAVPFQQNRWMPEARLALCLQFHLKVVWNCPHIDGGCRKQKLLDVTAITCEQDSSGRVISSDGAGTAINGRNDTIALASLVCVASGFHLRPSRASTTGMVPIC
jgi:hypothetical protein